ncbi:dolichyl-diphosphooligosaccharide--protein glycosyltransferase subunit TMEM258, partial [Epargyreus clarus]|uniref:dolichyl-diphosphooligosaccharide--protein glycosyltransferase subunit TMEM258 n=1 Tax=Epargyreus clarus TaxID=520877 RepID=UPI003C2BB67A
LIFQLEIESMVRYASPINPAIFPHLTFLLLGIAIFFTAWFFVYEVTSSTSSKDIFKELALSLVASIFSGFGIIFLLLWVGIFV